MWMVWSAALLILTIAGTASAQRDADAIKVVHIVPLVGVGGVYEDQLQGVAFTIQNHTRRPLVSVKLEALFRNPTGELIDSQTWDVDFVSTSKDRRGKESVAGEPLAPGLAKQITKDPLSIRGFRSARGPGTVSLRVVDYKLVE